MAKLPPASAKAVAMKPRISFVVMFPCVSCGRLSPARHDLGAALATAFAESRADAHVRPVRAALAAVESGNVDAGIVYKTDAAISKKVRIAYAVPAESGPSVCPAPLHAVLADPTVWATESR